MWLVCDGDTVRAMEHEGDYESGDTLVLVEPVPDRSSGSPWVKIEIRPTQEVHYRE